MEIERKIRSIYFLARSTITEKRKNVGMESSYNRSIINLALSLVDCTMFIIRRKHYEKGIV